MSSETPTRLRAVLDLLRPRTFFRTLSRVDPLIDATRSLVVAVEALRVRTEQLSVIQQIDWERRLDLARLDEWLEPARIERHVFEAVSLATLEREPFPHIVVEGCLPGDVYANLIDAIPPPVFFQGGRHEHWKLRESLAPNYCRAVWDFVANTLTSRILCRALNAKFAEVVHDYVGSVCPDYSPEQLHASDGRLMLRRPGYELQPHRDPKWGFVTGLMYLARPDDNERYGTRFYKVRDDVEAPDANVYYVDPGRCELVRSVPFRPNTLVAFLNSRGGHGASIPGDAQPASLERYIYQFRLGPSKRAVADMLGLMAPERAARWAGSKTAAY